MTWTQDDESIWVEYQKDRCFGYWVGRDDDPRVEYPVPNEPDHMSYVQTAALHSPTDPTDDFVDRLPEHLRTKVLPFLADAPPADLSETENNAPAARSAVHRGRGALWLGLSLLLTTVALLLALTIIGLPVALVVWIVAGGAFTRGLACFGRL